MKSINRATVVTSHGSKDSRPVRCWRDPRANTTAGGNEDIPIHSRWKARSGRRQRSRNLLAQSTRSPNPSPRNGGEGTSRRICWRNCLRRPVCDLSASVGVWLEFQYLGRLPLSERFYLAECLTKSAQNVETGSKALACLQDSPGVGYVEIQLSAP